GRVTDTAGTDEEALLIPSIVLLKKAFPHAAIDILAEKRNSDVFAFCSDVSAVYHYEIPSELFKAIRQTYDVVIDSEQWHRLSAVVARMTRAPISIGFATNERKKLFTHLVSYSHNDYEMDSFMNLVELLIHNVTRERSMPFLTISPEVTDTVRPLLEPLMKRKIVALFPGSSIDERRWGNDRFHQAAKLLSDWGYGIAVVGGNEDIKAGQEIAAGISTALNLCGKLSLPETAAVLKESALLIAGDSGIMHVGYGLGIKIVALFGPGRELKWAPRSSQVAVINKNLSCSPCTKFGYTPKCPIDAECMKRITVDEVFAKARALMQK
ncbi:MAG: glycosyltransferase family 9 protein, partial [Nitrospirae bacterium]|nr:glycosyltransferase family 9 protein [Nitrospirota bacterium]